MKEKNVPIQASTTLSVTEKSTGIFDNDDKGQVNFDVYPKPFTERLYISYYIEHPSDVLVEIVNLSGQLIHFEKKYETHSSHEINWVPRKDLPKGVYIVKILANGMVGYKKAILR